MQTALNAVKDHLQRLEPTAQGVWRERIQEVVRAIDGADERCLSSFGKIDLAYQGRNLIRGVLAGLPNENRLIANVQSTLVDVEDLPGIDPELIERLARQLFQSSHAKRGDHIVIAGSKPSMQVIEAIVKLCEENEVEFVLDITDDAVHALTLNGTTAEGVAALAKENADLYEQASCKIVARTNPNPKMPVDPDKSRLYSMGLADLTRQFQKGEKHYILTIIPTPADAEKDGMSYEDYLKLFFEACDQPWDEIKKVQRKLVERFDAGKEVHIVNDDGTDVTFNIEGQTFANSVILRNYPGSELFSSPVRTGVEGTIVAKGRFQLGDSGLIEDITLIFQDGRIIDFDAVTGRDALAKILNRDEGKGDGTRYLGELGIGTNPHLRRHTLNPLLVEKVGGSFHVAVGNAYAYTEYDGRPVNLNNGNQSHSGTHWDVTTLLRGKGGKMYLDGELVQDNGDWIGEDYDVLNKGWGALPEAEQPDWWKERYPEGYTS